MPNTTTKRKEQFKGSSKSSGTASAMLANSGVQLHTGAVTICSSMDQSWYCFFTRIIGYISMALFVLAIVYVIYAFVWPYFMKSGKRGGRGRGRK